MFPLCIEYPYPEQVEIRVYNYNQVIARTDFMFYQRTVQMPPPSDMILQILSSQLQSHFPGGGSNGMGGANGGRANESGDHVSPSHTHLREAYTCKSIITQFMFVHIQLKHNYFLISIIIML